MLLDLVAQVVANNGTLPQLSDIPSGRNWFSRNTGFKLSAIWFVLVVLILLPLSGISGAPDEVSGSLAIIGIFGALLMMLISWMFLPKNSKLNVGVPVQQADSARQVRIGGSRAAGALPPQQSIPASAYAPPAPGSWRDTNDLQPTSVTESTTRLLEKEGDQ